MKIALAHPTGNSNVRAVLTGLNEAGFLAEFSTTFAVNPHAQWLNLFPAHIRRQYLRRAFPVPAHALRTHPYLELARMVCIWLGLEQPVTHETGWASVDAVYQYLDNAVGCGLTKGFRRHGLDAVYTYEDGALATFIEAKKLGIKCIYELPIAYWEFGKALLLEEADRLPAWARTLQGGISDSASKVRRKTRELELADIVVVPSQFVKDSLPAWSLDKSIIMAPFGSPPSATVPHTLQYKRDTANRPLRILFAGSMGQRKGLADLFAAIRLLDRPDIELVVMGTLLAPLSFYRSQLPSFKYEPPRPHQQVLELMQSCDIFCLPSIVEGRALVMQEAMSQGLPLIITPNTGGADLIEEGRTGFLAPIRSPEALAEKILWFIHNRSALPQMRQNAQAHAATFTWQRYSELIISNLRKIFC